MKKAMSDNGGNMLLCQGDMRMSDCTVSQPAITEEETAEKMQSPIAEITL